MGGTNQRLEAAFEVNKIGHPPIENKIGHPSIENSMERLLHVQSAVAKAQQNWTWRNKIGHGATKLDTHQLKNWWESCCIFSPLLPKCAIWLSGFGVLCVIAPNSFVGAQRSFA
ncbi:hypothetical protein [Microbulbifer thermotolerans]|uniref:hypothetical protein n=1 Tax=Microbulbifer thermotolerans TaxID=252514 RepID=UPI0012E85F92|nr:hypothetical protein [Microbulbifer thermotolerans]